MSEHGRHQRLQDRLRHAVLWAPAVTDAALRRAVYHGQDVPEPLSGYVQKLRRYAYQVQDSDIEQLRGAGYCDDDIFEITIAAALGAGDERRHAGLSALERALR